MTEDEIEDRIPRTDRRDLVDTLVEEGHDTDFFLEILLGILFLIELGISSWEGHLHISHPWSHHHLIGEPHQADTDPDDDDSEEDIDHILSDIHETIPECRPQRWCRLLRASSRPHTDGESGLVCSSYRNDTEEESVHCRIIPYTDHFTKKNPTFCFTREQNRAKKVIEDCIHENRLFFPFYLACICPLYIYNVLEILQ